MNENRRLDFCTECRMDTPFSLQKQNEFKVIKNKEYTFSITVAVCDLCGKDMSIPGLIDLNIQEIDEQYRAYEGIVSIDEIKKLMEIYHIGKAPLSLALGFGEITITRYLAGQIPSKEYSGILKKALSSPSFMKEKLFENKDKIAPAAFDKAMTAVIHMEELFCISDKMLQTIAYIFKKLDEVTPLMLQKLLYFIQGVSYAVNHVSMFDEECEAWIHGPVYPKVYRIFRDFKFNPIEDARFGIFEATENHLIEEEKNIINLVLNTFGEYSGKVLEKITHQESPWILARIGYGELIPCHEQILKENIESYYLEKHEKYDFSSENGLRSYIRDVLEKQL